MSGGFTKVYNSILLSTVWREPNHVRLVWITMLALCDANGRVEASIPGLADAARVSIGECEDALRRFQQPDPYSRTKDHEGRRIVNISGGWRLLNYKKYRDGRNPEKRREQNREAKVRQRSRQPRSANVSHGQPKVSQSQPPSAQAEAEAEAEAEGGIRTPPRDRFMESLTSTEDELRDDWQPKPRHAEQAKRDGLELDDEARAYRARRQRDRFRCADFDADFDGWLVKAKKFKRRDDQQRGSGSKAHGGPSDDWPTDRDISLRERIRSGEFGDKLRGMLTENRLDASLARRLIAERPQTRPANENATAANVARLTANIGRTP